MSTIKEAMVAKSDALHERVHAFIRGEGDDTFDKLACDIACHQARRVAPVRRLFEAVECDPGRLKRADDIPAVVVDAFRHRRIAAHPPADDTRVFLTSGTTAEARGRHALRRLDTYRHAALAAGHQMLFPDLKRARFVGLVAPEELAPESSLTFMLARFAEALGDDASFHWDGERLDFTGVAARLRTPPGPVLLAGTSFAFVHLLDATFQHLPLPTGSRIMQTGGFKGRSREIPANRLRRDLATRFGLPITRVVAEYGMTELGSQLYQPGVIDRTTVSYYRAPHWLRVQAVDPVSLEPVPAGEPGLARFVDLVNVDSAVALLTADRIRMVDPTTIELLGRQPGALPRGCSLTLEHLLQ